MAVSQLLIVPAALNARKDEKLLGVVNKSSLLEPTLCQLNLVYTLHPNSVTWF
jgi:hypothetical protein